MASQIPTFGADGNTYYDDSNISNCQPGPYPFQLIGPKTTYEVMLMTEGLFARVDMPGVSPDGEVTVAIENNTVVFRGEARVEAERMGYESPRVYAGSFELLFVPDLKRKIRSQVKNGVLRFVVPAMVDRDLEAAFGDIDIAAPELVVTVPLPLLSEKKNKEEKKENPDRNPFQVGGIKSTLEQFITTGDKMFLRSDLPGVERESVKQFFSEDRKWTHFDCEAPQEWEFEDEAGRFYSGKLGLNCMCCIISHVEACLFNGVLTLLVSKVKLEKNKNTKNSTRNQKGGNQNNKKANRKTKRAG